MFKSVSFNIFEENLEDVVYRDDFGAREEINKQPDKPDKAVEKTVQKTTEIIIKPLNEPDYDCGRKTTRSE